MGEKKKPDEEVSETFAMTSDPDVNRKIQKLLDGAKPASLDGPLADLVSSRPRFVFRSDGDSRKVGGFTQVSNGFENRSGTVIRKLSDSAYLVQVENNDLVVHEPHEAWK